MCFLKESAMLYLAKGYKMISISVCDFGRFVIVLCVSSLVKLKLRLQPAALPAGGGNSQFETWTLRKLASLRKLLLLWSKLCTTSLVTKAKVMQEMPINPRKLITATPNICFMSYVICWIFKHGNCNLNLQKLSRPCLHSSWVGRDAKSRWIDRTTFRIYFWKYPLLEGEEDPTSVRVV